MPDQYPVLTKEFLEREYFTNFKGMSAIAKSVGASVTSVRRRFRRYGLEARAQSQFIDSTGEPFGTWKVLRRVEGGRYVKFTCLCACGEMQDVLASNLRSGKSTCCRRCAKSKHLGAKHSNWQGHEEISGTFWNRIVCSACKRQLAITITIEYAWWLFLTQQRRCVLTGEVLAFPKNGVALAAGDYTASLDRIDSTIGYVEGNVQWVHKDVNRIKSDLPQSTFVAICLRVAQYQEHKLKRSA